MTDFRCFNRIRSPNPAGRAVTPSRDRSPPIVRESQAMNRPSVPFAPAFTAAGTDARTTGPRGELSVSEMLAGGLFRLVLAIEAAVDAIKARRNARRAMASETCQA